MQPNESLQEFRDAHLQAYSLGKPQSFLVFPIALTEVPPVLPYNRRDFYQIAARGVALAAPVPTGRAYGWPPPGRGVFTAAGAPVSIASPAQPLALHTSGAGATRLNVHVNYLSRMLREETGKTTSTHLAGRIAQEAQLLLRHSDWPIANIAEALGFTDPTYFNHFFRKYVGTSPRAFRQAIALPLAAPAGQLVL